jgi:hypothetical protein
MNICYLRVAGKQFAVDNFLSKSELATDSSRYTVWHNGDQFRKGKREDSGFMFDICVVESEGVKEQAEKAVTFMSGNFAELKRLMEFQGVEEGSLQFVINRRNDANQNDLFPAELVRLAGSLGLSILLSQYE